METLWWKIISILLDKRYFYQRGKARWDEEPEIFQREPWNSSCIAQRVVIERSSIPASARKFIKRKLSSDAESAVEDLTEVLSSNMLGI